MSDIVIPMDVMRDAVAEAVRVSRNAVGIVHRPATVSAVSADQTVAEVALDDDPSDVISGGDDVADGGVLGAQVLYSAVRSGDRVMVMFVPPHGAFVVGRLGGDYEEWNYVGDDGQPAFAASWSNGTDTGNLGTDNYSQVRFNRVGRMVNLSGRAMRSADTVGPSTIFTLPNQYSPDNRKSFAVANGPLGAPQAVVIVTLDGQVQSFKIGGSVGGGTSSDFISLDGITFQAAVDDGTS